MRIIRYVSKFKYLRHETTDNAYQMMQNMYVHRVRCSKK